MNNTTPAASIRKATREDASSIHRLADELARYEKLPLPDEDAKRRLINDMEGAHPRIEIFLAEVENRAVGYAIILESYPASLHSQRSISKISLSCHRIAG